MRLPRAQQVQQNIEFTQAFSGYDHNLRKLASSYNGVYENKGIFYDMENMSGDLYPVLASRPAHELDAQMADAKEIYVEGNSLLYVSHGTPQKLMYVADMTAGTWSPVEVAELTATEEPRKFAQIGAYIMMAPDMIIFNTETQTAEEIGFSFGRYEDTDRICTMRLRPCDINGEVIPSSGYVQSATAPADKTKWWFDSQYGTVKKFSDVYDMWMEMNAYVLMSPTCIRKSDGAVIAYTSLTTAEKEWVDSAAARINGYAAYDAVTMEYTPIPELNGDVPVYNVVKNITSYDAGLVFLCNLSKQAAIPTYLTDSSFSFSRVCPDMDYICAMNNRIWGCSSENHEIYACKLGDPKQWHAYAGLKSDSYAVTIGTGGIFTGCAVLAGYMYFFKKDRYYKIFGDYPSNYQVNETPCQGVAEGSWASLMNVGGRLFYHAETGVMAFSGALPQPISECFGEERYKNAAAVRHEAKYYISLQDMADDWSLFVYDTDSGMWFKEDDTQLTGASVYDNKGYYTTPLEEGYGFYSFTKGYEPEECKWGIESHVLGLSTPDAKYIARIQFRIAFEGKMRFFIRYDEEEYQQVFFAQSHSMKSFTIPINVKRCDHFQWKMQGIGTVKLYSVGYVIQGGSERCRL